MITFREKEFSEIQKEFTAFKLTKGLQAVAKTFKPKGTSTARKLIKADKWALEKTADAVNKAQSIALNPGRAVTNTVKEGIQAPISTIAAAAPVPATAELYPVTSKLEKGLYKKLGFDRGLKRISDKYANSKAYKIVEGASNGVVNSLKSFG